MRLANMLVAAAMLLALTSCDRAVPLARDARGWSRAASASGGIPDGVEGPTECRWNLPCADIETGRWISSGGPVRLVCTGDAVSMFVESYRGEEPGSGNAHFCSDGDPSGAFVLARRGEVGFYLAGVAPIAGHRSASGPWTVVVEEWHGAWKEPLATGRWSERRCDRETLSGRPVGGWEKCAVGPTGFALAADPIPSP